MDNVLLDVKLEDLHYEDRSYSSNKLPQTPQVDIEAYSCNECSKSFRTKQNLNNHILIHSNKRLTSVFKLK